MKNNYIIVSNDKITINSRINNIINDINKKDIEVVRYNYPETSIDTVLEDLNTYNFLSNGKVIVYYYCSFLDKDPDKYLSKLKKYYQNPSDNYLILINDSINEKSEIKEFLNREVEVINTRVSSEVLIKNNLSECKMDNKTVKYFANYCLYNNEKILNELEKIKCYKYSEKDKNITVEDINNIVLKDYDEDIFALVNAIVQRNKDNAIEIYKRVSQKEKDTINIVAGVAYGIRNLYCVKVLKERKYNTSSICNILGAKEYSVKVAQENCDNYSTKKLLFLLDILADIDYRTKCSNISGNSLFELFLLSL